MEKAKVYFVKFENNDIIATSGGPQSAYVKGSILNLINFQSPGDTYNVQGATIDSSMECLFGTMEGNFFFENGNNYKILSPYGIVPKSEYGPAQVVCYFTDIGSDKDGSEISDLSGIFEWLNSYGTNILN